jgi:hypothetical protein
LNIGKRPFADQFWKPTDGLNESRRLKLANNASKKSALRFRESPAIRSSVIPGSTGTLGGFLRSISNARHEKPSTIQSYERGEMEQSEL